MAKLEILFDSSAPLGQRNSVVTVTNTLNNERIEVRTYATVVK